MHSSFDLRHNIGKIVPESIEDLSILKEVIDKGNLVTAKSPRSIKIKREGNLVRAKTGRKEVIMKIEVEKTELKESVLRLTGKIIEAPEDVEKGYHTIEVEPDKFLRIEKIWKSWEVDRIKSAERKHEPILILILDENEADFYFLKERYKHLFSITSEASGKRFDSKKSETKRIEYYAKILEELKKRSEKIKKIIIAGPGFARDDLQNLIRQRAKELLDKIIVDFTYQSGNLGLQELLKKGLVEKLTKYSRITEETNAVERLLEDLNKGKAVYGIEKTKEALENGQISLLLVSNTKVRDFEELLDTADKNRCNIMVISSEHDSGEKLLGLGGIGAILF
ncbi:mRNA surveillance protein pelota [Candidatus Micrarchaeota archaeon RBG_16_36_9]|nr:MAG: mRNA surveillance protein pelota [Candidatus Micrarchaeota archaeon RBG_16_36_9]